MLMVTPTSRLLLFHLCAACCFLLSYHVLASPFSFSFDFSNGSIYRSDDLLFEGNASINGRLVDLTCNREGDSMQGCMGRMSYKHPVPFYDTTTGEVASFYTRFNFSIGVFRNITPGDGMAFFLSSYPSMLPLVSGGGNLGLHDGDGMNVKGREWIIAVEFDKFKNFFDPSSDHIGIDINSVKAPVNTTTLPNFSLKGSMTATITFNSSSRMLLASLQFDGNPSLEPVQVSAQLPDPLMDLLPSEVAVGFSASTGRYFELHRITSWSFNSTLPFKGVTSHAVSRPLMIGGASLLLVILVVLIWFILAYYMHRRQGDSIVKEVGALAKRFEYRDLVVATEKFSQDRELGRGAFGIVYKGNMKDQNGQQHQVAVKKIMGSTGDFADFHAELKTISETRHKNLVRLTGWCSTNRSNFTDFMCLCRQKHNIQVFLVYELVSNGNLDMHLRSTEQVLPWAKRYVPAGIGFKFNFSQAKTFTK